MNNEKTVALGGLLALVTADVATTAMILLVGFTPALVGPTVVVVLLAALAFRGLRWARWLLVVLAVLRLVVVAGWLADAVAARQVMGVILTLGFAASYGVAVYVLGVSRPGRTYFERRRAGWVPELT